MMMMLINFQEEPLIGRIFAATTATKRAITPEIAQKRTVATVGGAEDPTPGSWTEMNHQCDERCRTCLVKLHRSLERMTTVEVSRMITQ
jgi:hypothetical protein